jgi:WXG100 family type VII secretion target
LICGQPDKGRGTPSAHDFPCGIGRRRGVASRTREPVAGMGRRLVGMVGCCRVFVCRPLGGMARRCCQARRDAGQVVATARASSGEIRRARNQFCECGALHSCGGRSLMRYRVELDGLLAFVDKLQAFEQHAELIAARVDEQIAGLHESWAGEGAYAHVTLHHEWMSAAKQMREALSQLRHAAHSAHRNYAEAAQLNVAMLA